MKNYRENLNEFMKPVQKITIKEQSLFNQLIVDIQSVTGHVESVNLSKQIEEEFRLVDAKKDLFTSSFYSLMKEEKSMRNTYDAEPDYLN